jgi:hypothetical protein
MSSAIDLPESQKKFDEYKKYEENRREEEEEEKEFSKIFSLMKLKIMNYFKK